MNLTYCGRNNQHGAFTELCIHMHLAFKDSEGVIG